MVIITIPYIFFCSLTHLDADDRPEDRAAMKMSTQRNRKQEEEEEENDTTTETLLPSDLLLGLVNVLLVLLVFLPDLLLIELGRPFERGFFCSDPSIAYPYRDSTVTSHVLYATGVLLPAVVVFVVEIVGDAAAVGTERTCNRQVREVVKSEGCVAM